MSMDKYEVEITDTFGGEANYCWAKRFVVHASSIRGAITKVAREHGGGFRLAYGDSEHARYNLRGQNVCAFVTFLEQEG